MKIKWLILMFVFASFIDASLTIVGLVYGWHGEANVLVNLMISISGSVVEGVILHKCIWIVVVCTCITILHDTNNKLVTCVIIASSIMTSIAGLLWLV